VIEGVAEVETVVEKVPALAEEFRRPDSTPGGRSLRAGTMA
jgi:hypothetical protein